MHWASNWVYLYMIITTMHDKVQTNREGALNMGAADKSNCNFFICILFSDHRLTLVTH